MKSVIILLSILAATVNAEYIVSYYDKLFIYNRTTGEKIDDINLTPFIYTTGVNFSLL